VEQKMSTIILLVCLLEGFVKSQSFLSLHNDAARSESSPAGCPRVDAQSCVRTDVSLDMIESDDTIELPDGTAFVVVRRDERMAVFKTEGGEAIFTWKGNLIVGSVHLNGNSWQLQGCGNNCYLWIKYINNWPDEETLESRSASGDLVPGAASNAALTELFDQGKSDSVTVVNYSIMIWYTPQFRATFPSDEEMNLFIDQIFDETNQGYINSEIPVRAVKHDVKQHPNLTDISDSSAMLSAFADSMSLSDLLNCADSTALLIEEFSSCGIAYLDRAFSCGAISVTKKSCATGYYSFGHEIGHNFGAQHNPEEYTSTSGDGYGHLIQPTDENKFSGYRTILAYFADGHSTRVNHYSNPNVLYNNNPTGVEGLSNNARLITANRFAMASCGTEEPNGECNDCSVNPANEPCLNCCETVTINSSDPTFLASVYRILAGTYSKYTDSPSKNGRMVYKLQSGDYCLYFSDCNTWAINTCSNIGSCSYFMGADASNKQCVHGEGLVWTVAGGIGVDSTMSAGCSLECSDDPPTAPSGAVSNWDGTTKTAGSIVTYSCSSSSNMKKATCDPSTTSWIPATIPSDLCGSVITTTGAAPTTTRFAPSTTTITGEVPVSMTSTTTVSTTTTTGEVPVTITTTIFPPATSTTFMSTTTSLPPTTTPTTVVSTTAAFKECGFKNKVPYLKKLKTSKNVATAEDCQKICVDYPGCEYFKWKTNRRPKKRSCQLLAVSFKSAKGGFTSGRVRC